MEENRQKISRQRGSGAYPTLVPTGLSYPFNRSPRRLPFQNQKQASTVGEQTLQALKPAIRSMTNKIVSKVTSLVQDSLENMHEHVASCHEKQMDLIASLVEQVVC